VPGCQLPRHSPAQFAPFSIIVSTCTLPLPASTRRRRLMARSMLSTTFPILFQLLGLALHFDHLPRLRSTFHLQFACPIRERERETSYSFDPGTLRTKQQQNRLFLSSNSSSQFTTINYDLPLTWPSLFLSLIASQSSSLT
jgi:hypothetical protein